MKIACNFVHFALLLFLFLTIHQVTLLWTIIKKGVDNVWFLVKPFSYSFSFFFFFLF